MAGHKVTSFLKGVREYVYPVLQSSAFLERGVLTPQEFVAAGDQLVYRCPTWSWEAGDPSKAKSYLPPDKQFLVTRNVPCHRRATAFAKEYVAETEVEGFGDGEDGGGDGEGWLATHVAPAQQPAPQAGGAGTGAGAGAAGVMEEVELGSGSSSAERAHLSAAGRGAHPPVSPDVVLVEGAGEEEEEAPAAVVLLAPGMVTVVDEHFSVARGEGQAAAVADGPAGAAPSTAGAAATATGAAATAAAAAAAGAGAGGGGGQEGEEDDMAGYADLASYEESALAAGAAEDEAVLTPSLSGGLAAAGSSSSATGPLPYLRTEEPAGLLAARTYDISITYDKYYQTPRAWLMGYDEEGQVLGQAALFEDIMQDYANRTVTVEAHPHTGLPQASIHPCQHANVMKNMVRNLSAGGDESRVPRVDQYLFIFLKFVQSVIPTIEYDFTIEIEGR